MKNKAKFFNRSSTANSHYGVAHKRRLNQIIVHTFEWIEKSNYNERIINKALTELLQTLELQAKAVNPIHISALINRLSQLDLMCQTNANETFNAIVIFVLNKSYELLSVKKTKQMFTGREVASLLNGLPKLPISTSKQKRLIRALLDLALALSEVKALSLQDSIQIGGGIAKLSINLNRHLALTENLLDMFDAQQSDVAQLDALQYNEIWQFCVYAKICLGATKKLEQFIQHLEVNLLEKTMDEINSSQLQKAACSFVTSLLKKEFKEQIQQEYAIGAYRLDIALPSVSLDIEIDGPFHYRGQELRRVDKFRDFILSQYLKWHTVRIPHFEYEPLPTSQDKKDYLLLKLADYPQLLNDKALARLEFLTSKQNTEPLEPGLSSLLSEQGLHRSTSNLSLVEDVAETTHSLADMSISKCLGI